MKEICYRLVLGQDFECLDQRPQEDLDWLYFPRLIRNLGSPISKWYRRANLKLFGTRRIVIGTLGQYVPGNKKKQIRPYLALEIYQAQIFIACATKIGKLLVG